MKKNLIAIISVMQAYNHLPKIQTAQKHHLGQQLPVRLMLITGIILITQNPVQQIII